MGILTALGLFLLGSAVQLTLETSSELTAEMFSDNDVGITRAPIQIATGDIINISPAGMIIIR